MSIVIVGGHDRIICHYRNICKNFVIKRKIKPSKTMEITTTGIPPQICEPGASYSYALYINVKSVEPDYSKTTDNRSEQ